MKKFNRFLISFLLFSFLTVSSAFAGSITIGWNANTESDLAGYRVHIGSVSGDYSSNIDVKNVTEHKIENLVPGFYYIALTAYDTSNLESDYSNEVFGDVGNFPPAPPTGCMIIEIMPD